MLGRTELTKLYLADTEPGLLRESPSGGAALTDGAALTLLLS